MQDCGTRAASPHGAPVLNLNIPLPRLIGPADVIGAPGALAVLAKLPATRIAVIATERAVGHASVKRLFDGQKAATFTLIHPSWTGVPTLDGLAGTLNEIESLQPDWLVALGGGRVMDGAKLCWAFYEHPSLDRQRLELPFSIPPLRRRARFAAVPTTAGTGSEASSSAVYYDPTTERMIPATTHDFLPDLVVLDASLTTELPPAQTAMTALDALAHAIEGYVSKQDNPLVDPFAEQAVRMILAALRSVAKDQGDVEARQRLLTGAFFAGYVQNLRLVGPAHAIAHQLGIDVPHGLATGLLLPEVMEFNSRSGELAERYDRLAHRAGLRDREALLESLREIPGLLAAPDRLNQWPGVPESLSDEKLAAIGKQASDDPLSRFFPVPVSAQEIQMLLRAAW